MNVLQIYEYVFTSSENGCFQAFDTDLQNLYYRIRSIYAVRGGRGVDPPPGRKNLLIKMQ